ncbi:MAG: 2OG-Fe(II) oxygenase, partial [Gluconacetobacter diazotrophicus]|nr:2OG-Fe(II) oxygenase [Gluconacetobacter diazotrophicus]
RRFAVSINLNDGFEGGELVFPEFGSRRHRPPAGGALVFSCSLLHAVTPVTAGTRFAFLPFVHDAPAAALKRANLSAAPRT